MILFREFFKFGNRSTSEILRSLDTYVLDIYYKFELDRTVKLKIIEFQVD